MVTEWRANLSPLQRTATTTAITVLERLLVEPSQLSRYSFYPDHLKEIRKFL